MTSSAVKKISTSSTSSFKERQQLDVDNFRSSKSTSSLKSSFFTDYANRALSQWRQRIWRNVLGIEEIEEPNVESEMNGVRYRPEALLQLCLDTKFTKHELQLLYRGFKEGCPSGIVTLDKFKEIYSCFFPHGDSSKYAAFVFNTFDRDHDGQMSFDEFVFGLSILSRGTEEEKLKWVFQLYDVDSDGYLSKYDMNTVLESIYDMMGSCTDPPIESRTVREHVDSIFGKMDLNSDGLITLEEFLKACKEDPNIKNSLHLFDTVFMNPAGVTSAMTPDASSSIES